jgi:hypothetical protein
MDIFNYLHVVGGDNDAHIAQRLHLSTAEAGYSQGHGSGPTRGVQRPEHVLRISAPAYRKRDVMRLHESDQLLGKNVFVTGIVRPSCKSREIVGES